MGLCKCERRKVTNLFCFEHRVNVCEHCMVTAHGCCIIQTYLAWLTDSEFLPVCKICLQPHTFGQCIRFPCFHVFHIGCVNDKFKKFPKSTAPPGFKCPDCNEKVFPKLNSGGPVAEQVRNKLKEFSWARTGLGLPLLATSNDDKSCNSSLVNSIFENKKIVVTNDEETCNLKSSLKEQKDEVVNNAGIKLRKNVRYNENENTEIEIPSLAAIVNNKTPLIDATNPNLQDDSNAFKPPILSNRTPDADFKAFKYRRKSIFQRIKRLVQNHIASQKYSEPIMGKSTPILVCLVIIVILLFIWISTDVVTSTRSDDHYNDLFDIKNNPNIRTSDTKIVT